MLEPVDILSLSQNWNTSPLSSLKKLPWLRVSLLPLSMVHFVRVKSSSFGLGLRSRSKTIQYPIRLAFCQIHTPLDSSSSLSLGSILPNTSLHSRCMNARSVATRVDGYQAKLPMFGGSKSLVWGLVNYPWPWGVLGVL